MNIIGKSNYRELRDIFPADAGFDHNPYPHDNWTRVAFEGITFLRAKRLEAPMPENASKDWHVIVHFDARDICDTDPVKESFRVESWQEACERIEELAKQAGLIT